MQLRVFHDALTLSHNPISAQKEAPRKRKHSSRDSSQVRTGKCSLFPKGQPPSPSYRAQTGRWLGASEHLREAKFSVHVGSEEDLLRVEAGMPGKEWPAASRL